MVIEMGTRADGKYRVHQFVLFEEEESPDFMDNEDYVFNSGHALILDLASLGGESFDPGRYVFSEDPIDENLLYNAFLIFIQDGRPMFEDVVNVIDGFVDVQMNPTSYHLEFEMTLENNRDLSGHYDGNFVTVDTRSGNSIHFDGERLELDWAVAIDMGEMEDGKYRGHQFILFEKEEDPIFLDDDSYIFESNYAMVMILASLGGDHFDPGRYIYSITPLDENTLANAFLIFMRDGIPDEDNAIYVVGGFADVIQEGGVMSLEFELNTGIGKDIIGHYNKFFHWTFE